ncbi:MAG: hypothetical protein AB1486_01100 [Planctomycetota bacterium]
MRARDRRQARASRLTPKRKRQLVLCAALAAAGTVIEFFFHPFGLLTLLVAAVWAGLLLPAEWLRR